MKAFSSSLTLRPDDGGFVFWGVLGGGGFEIAQIRRVGSRGFIYISQKGLDLSPHKKPFFIQNRPTLINYIAKLNFAILNSVYSI